jgi:hypothetical protein
MPGGKRLFFAGPLDASQTGDFALRSRRVGQGSLSIAESPIRPGA